MSDPSIHFEHNHQKGKRVPIIIRKNDAFLSLCKQMASNY